MKLAILIAAINPRIGGVLFVGDRGTGKSTAVRALAALLPPMRAVVGCRYRCDPALPVGCEDCEARRRQAGAALNSHLVPVPVVACHSAPPKTASSVRSTWNARWRKA